MFGRMKAFEARCETYAEARAYYAECKPWRDAKHEGAERPLKGRRNRTSGVLINSDGCVVFRLHDTDVVAFDPNGDIVIEGYSSVMTSSFVNNVVGRAIYPRMTAEHICVDGMAYMLKHGSSITIHPDLTATPDRQWRRYIVDRKAANALRKEYGIDKIRQWLRAAVALQPARAQSHLPYDHPFYIHSAHGKALAALRDRSYWPDLTHATLDRIVRQLIRNEGALVEAEPLTAIPEKSVASYRKSWDQYGEPCNYYRPL